MSWGEGNVAKLDQMRRDGKTWGQIAKSLGKTESAVASFSRDRARRAMRPQPAPKRNPTYMTVEEASESLRVAVIRTINRYAVTNKIHIDQAARTLLSGVSVDNEDNRRSATVHTFRAGA